MSRAVTVSFNSMGGSSVASDTFIVGDYYYKSNLYDPNNTNRNSAITLSNNIFTVNYSSSRNAWLNFNQPYSEEAFAPNITYTIVGEIMNFSVSGTDYSQLAIFSPNEGGTSQTDMARGHFSFHVTGNGVYTGTITTKNMADYASYPTKFNCRSYITIQGGTTVSYSYRISIFVGTPTISNFAYAPYGNVPSSNTLPTPTRAGYTFDGWYLDSNYTTPVTRTTIVSYTSSHTLYAKWNPITYQIEWDGNATAGSLLPSRYWNYAGSGGYTSSNTGDNSSYTTNDATVSATSSVVYGSDLGYYAPIPIRSSYTFNGWYTATSGGTRVVDNAGNLVASVSGYTDSAGCWARASNTTLYAQWSAKSYTITYSLGSGGSLSSRPSSYSVTSNQTIGTPTRSGYQFAGWTITMNLDKLYSGFINNSTGVMQYSSSYPNSVFYELFYIQNGIDYTATTSGGAVRWRTWQTTGTYVGSSSLTTLNLSGDRYAMLLYHLGCTNATMPISFTVDDAFDTQNYNLVGDLTLTANWTANTYYVSFNGNGSTGGSMSRQTFRYGTAQKLTSNGFTKIGFTFAGWNRNANGTGTSYSNGQSVSNLTTSNGATITLYAQWTARNEAKYDSAGKYWYIENGKIPQTKVTNSTLITNLNKATTNGSNYYIAGQTLTAKVYSGKEYCKWNNNWYEVEPIKWRLDASSSQKDGYGTTTDTNAVLAEIVYVDQYSSTSIDAGEGYSNQSVTDFMRNGISTTYLVNYATSTQTFGSGTSLYGTNASTTARMFVSSQSEINAVNGTMNMTFSDLVEDMIKYYGGTNVYFTRDLGSNYNNIVCFNEVGREVQRFATDYRGVQFTVRFTEYGCVA